MRSLRARWRRSRPASAAPATRCQRPPSGRRSSRARSSLATARLRRGQLLVPDGDSARAYLDRAAELDANDPRVAALRADLAAALMAAARLVADSDVAAATNLAPKPAAGRRRACAARRARTRDRRGTRAAGDQPSHRAARGARERVQNGALFAPPNDSALDTAVAVAGRCAGSRRARRSLGGASASGRRGRGPRQHRDSASGRRPMLRYRGTLASAGRCGGSGAARRRARGATAAADLLGHGRAGERADARELCAGRLSRRERSIASSRGGSTSSSSSIAQGRRGISASCSPRGRTRSTLPPSPPSSAIAMSRSSSTAESTSGGCGSACVSSSNKAARSTRARPPSSEGPRPWRPRPSESRR